MALLRRPIACRQAVDLVTDYLEGSLSRRERERFENHLRACPHCGEYLAQIRVTVAAVGRVEPESLDPRAREDLIELYRRWKAG